jgi:hypothetical protein
MRLMFVYWQPENAGSAQTIHKYSQAARKLGHEVVLYAPQDETSPFCCSLDVEAADAVIFLLEWNLYLLPGGSKKDPRRRMRAGLMGIGHLNVVKLLSRVPRERRIIIDNDGMYNDVICVGGDYTHTDAASSRARTELCDMISDRIYQPTLHPLRPNVRTLLFHGYDPGWEKPLDFHAKEYGMVYVGSNWFRWRALRRVLQAIEPIRKQVGRIGLVGHDWGVMPSWVPSPLREEAYYTDPEYLRKLDVEIMPAVPVRQVIPTMGQGMFNPVLVRPTFNHLRLLNPRLFETPAASTIPLFGLDKEYVQEVYGERAGDLVLGEDAADQIVDVLQRPEHYAQILQEMRRHLAANHSYEVRLQELIGIVES